MKNSDRFSIVIFFWFFATFIGSANAAWGLTEKAQQIYERSSASVYQIQIIDLKSNEKSTIGSGFRFSKKGLFATNYHVISDVVATPERYRIEYVNANGERGDLILKALDVAHDLAVLQGEASDKAYLSFATASMSKGDHVFPMGNPLDLGMTITEGIYNGLVGEDLYQRILLSASLNGGMSGGPAFNSKGKVIGINVSIEGNDLSYLVPAEYLLKLAGEITGKEETQEWQAVIQDQILEKYNKVIHKILKAKWSVEDFGSLKIPQNIAAADIKCWGKTEPEDIPEKQFYSYSYKWCRSESNIYLSSDFSTGTIGYYFISLGSKSLNPLEFYKVYSAELSETDFLPYVGEKDVTEFRCQSDFVKIAGHDWKGSYCARQYKKYPKLHDVFLTFAALGEAKQGHIVRIGLAGLDEPLARRFLQKFLGGIQWVE